jgi:hypothetical protein
MRNFLTRHEGSIGIRSPNGPSLKSEGGPGNIAAWLKRPERCLCGKVCGKYHNDSTR